MVEKILRSFPQRFESLVVTLEKTKTRSVFTIDELQASLINHEHRINRSNTSLEGAFATQSSIIHGRGRRRNNSRGRGRSSSIGGRGSSHVNVIGKGQNQNTSQRGGHMFDK